MEKDHEELCSSRNSLTVLDTNEGTGENVDDLAQSMRNIAIQNVSESCTPMKSRDSEVCAVCLSPLVIKNVLLLDDEDQQDTEGRQTVVTKCKHLFHQKCLELCKLCKCECPMCRTALSPLEAKNTSQELTMLKESIVRAARRGRDAVRIAWLRRQGQTQSE